MLMMCFNFSQIGNDNSFDVLLDQEAGRTQRPSFVLYHFFPSHATPASRRISVVAVMTLSHMSRFMIDALTSLSA